ncbi:hypothetical protein GGG16DRAFT_124900 [Schizophyllum commune]
MVATPGLPPALLAQVPVSQPAHLEGDNSLATEILPGPPSVQSARLAALKRDPHSKKAQYLYLPAADPGTSYAGIAGFGFANEVDEPVETNGKRSKTAAGSSTRAQRASARHLTAAPRPIDENPPEEPMTQPIAPAELEAIAADASQPSRSHSVEAPAADASASAPARPKGRPKGKGKDREMSHAVKEESKTVSPEPPVHAHRNEDYCSSCHSGQTSGGASFVYCDGCPRAFHISCLDPPKSSIDEERWFCVSCTAKMNPPRKTPPHMLSSIIDLVESSNATEFQLPESIRTYFKDVTTGPRGMYLETTSVKPHRPNRQGQLEERDPYRLRDRNGNPVLCYACGLSALPDGAVNRADTPEHPSSASVVSQQTRWKSIVSCDFCSSHWHLDCLDPPEAMPPLSKKWKCPNHADRIVRPKNRIPKDAKDEEILHTGQFNNGNIEIVPMERNTSQQSNKMDVDELTINGRRYRVPEKVIVLDFWNKVATNPPSEEIKDHSVVYSPPRQPSRRDELEQFAQLLSSMPQLSVSAARPSPPAPPPVAPPPGQQGPPAYPSFTPWGPNPSPPAFTPWPSLIPPLMPAAYPPVPPPATVPTKESSARGRSAKSQGKQRQQAPKLIAPQANQDIVFHPQPLPAPVAAPNGTAPRIIGYSNGVKEVQSATGVRKRKKPTPLSVPPSTRELRRKSEPAKEKDPDSSLSSLSSLEDLQDRKPDITVESISATAIAARQKASAQPAAVPAPAGSGPRQVNGHAGTPNGVAAPSAIAPAPSQGAQDEKKTRGARKRKERTDEDGTHIGWRSKASPGVQKAKEARPVSAKEKKASRPVSGAASADAKATPSAPPTPSLKIRLPRLTSLNSSASIVTAPPVSQPAVEAPSR